MNLTWIEVVDSIVKIGLGSIITAISGYIVIKSNQKNQDIKEKKDRFYKLQEQRAELYANFLAQSHKLVQMYLNTKCDCSTEEYIIYLNTFGRLQISSSNEIRIVSYLVLNSVNEFIVIDKNFDVELIRKIRINVNDSLGRFQAVAQEEINKEFK